MSTHTSASIFLVGCALFIGGCRFDNIRFYDVTRTPTEQCEIRPDGEFCDPDQLPPALVETWTVEQIGAQTRVYIDETVWVGLPLAEKDDSRQVKATTLEVATRDPGPCTTTTTGDFNVLATDQDITGELHEKVRLEGGADCGDTPRGTRGTARIDGVIADAP